ncbi:MAG: AraC-like DNA-binding protein [Arenicella sp.]|jgi:AraC-like DNA-binding protein
MSPSITGIITLFLAFLSVLLSVFLFTVKNRLSNRLLSIYFLIFAIHISVFFYAEFITLPLVIECLRDQIMFLSSPLLYLYLVSSIYANFKLQPKHLLHFIPFLAIVLLYFPRFYLAGENERLIFMQNSEQLEFSISSIFGPCKALFYLILMFVELSKYKNILESNYSDKMNFKWLYQLTVLLTIIFFISQFKQLYLFFGDDERILNIIYISLTLLLLSFLTWIVFKSLYQPNLFRQLDDKYLISDSFLSKEMRKPSSTPYSELSKKLDEFMLSEEPFLDSSLTLNSLAEKRETSARELSILINQAFNKHFFDFVNEYRIRKAKQLLENSNQNKLTVQQIMYDVGFNSKSSFYAEFKKQTSQTPSQYKKSYLSGFEMSYHLCS